MIQMDINKHNGLGKLLSARHFNRSSSFKWNDKLCKASAKQSHIGVQSPYRILSTMNSEYDTRGSPIELLASQIWMTDTKLRRTAVGMVTPCYLTKGRQNISFKLFGIRPFYSRYAVRSIPVNDFHCILAMSNLCHLVLCRLGKICVIPAFSRSGLPLNDLFSNGLTFLIVKKYKFRRNFCSQTAMMSASF